MSNWVLGLITMNSDPKIREKRVQKIREAGLRKRKMSLKDRLFRKVLKTEGCWNFKGKTNLSGYGTISIWEDGELVGVLAHRLSWMIHFGQIPEGLSVCHHCDNPSCVRPDHLFLGTQQDNMTDMVSKGRGHKFALRKLSSETIRQIRQEWGKVSVRVICERYKIGPTPARRIGLRETYKNVE